MIERGQDAACLAPAPSAAQLAAAKSHSGVRAFWPDDRCAPPGSVLGVVPDVAGSGDKQASAKLCCVEIDEVAVAFGPPT
jgi:hypothetical protein